MQFNKEKNIFELDCLTCSNNRKICPCQIYSGNPELPNLFNKNFPVKENNYRGGHEEIYKANLR